MEKLQIPVKKNQYIEMEFTDLGHDGEGVGKYQGYTLFVPGALPKERALVKIIKAGKSFGYGRLIEILQASPNRVEPKCSIYKRCGGCQLQHLSYAGQLAAKRELVRSNLKRIGKIDDAIIHPTIGMSNPWHYRNKAQVPFAEREGALISGFYAKGTHDVIEMKQCLIQQESGDYLVQLVKKIALELNIPAYNEQTHQGIIRHVVTRIGVNTGEKMLIIVTTIEDFPNKPEFIKRIINELPTVTSLIQNINNERTNVVLGYKSITIHGRDVIYDTIGDIKFAISPKSFYQVNPEQTRVLYDKAFEYADLSGNETVIDAYCGVGTISLFLAQKAKHVYGVEIINEAIKDAKKNAELNGITNITFAVGSAEEVLPKWREEGINIDVIVVDPPRKGLEPTLIDTIGQIMPKRIVYVSCNPSTLARDLRLLEDRGFKTLEVQPVDMFPQTMHIESVTRIERVKP